MYLPRVSRLTECAAEVPTARDTKIDCEFPETLKGDRSGCFCRRKGFGGPGPVFVVSYRL